MKKIVLFICLFMVTASSFSQIGRRGANAVRRPLSGSSEPTDAEKENFKKQMKEKQQEFITEFLVKLEADAFQQEIIRTTLTDYFDKIVEFSKIKFKRQIEQKDALKAFNENHFAELKTLISENDMKKITDLIEGNNEEENDDKKKKKRKKRKRNKDKEDDSNDDDN